MRKKIGLGILFSAVVILIFSVFADSFSGRFDTITADPDTIASVKSMRAGASNPDFDIFFNDQKLLFDASLNTFFYSVPQNDKYAYNPRVHISASEDLQILFDDSGITPKSIEQNIPVSVIVYSDSEYWESSLVCTTLPIINIGCDNDIGMDYSPMSFYLYDNNCGQFSSSIESDGLIHLRGHSALNYPKRAYRIKLTTESLGNHQRANDVSLLSMRQDDDWLLYAAYNDQEKIRNVFSQNLWKNSCSSDNQYHVETGCEYKYVELFINSEYNGLYALGYPIDEKLLNFNGDLAKNALFKKVDYSNEQSFYINENNELTGYELKTSDGNIDSISLVPGSGSSWSLLTDYYFALSEHAGDTDFLYKGIDLDNAIDNYLFLNQFYFSVQSALHRFPMLITCLFVV